MTEFGAIPDAKRLIAEYLMEHLEGATIWELRMLMTERRDVSKSLADVLRYVMSEMLVGGEVVRARRDRVKLQPNGRSFREPVYRLSFDAWVELVA